MAIEQQAFDSEAFGMPYFRVTDATAPDLEARLAEVRALRPVMIDAKIPAGAVDLAHRLQKSGMSLVCTQIELDHDLAGDTQEDSGVNIAPAIEMPEEVIHAHAANFVYDRFTLDHRVPRHGRTRLYANWIRNSVTAGRCNVAHIGHDFCTFAENRGDDLVIDLVSVLNHGMGTGRRLMAAVVAHAGRLNKTGIRVVTECENRPALNLYRNAGFHWRSFTSVYHFVAL